jgi:hypothetical protein
MKLLCNYLKQTKMSFFKNGNQEDKTSLALVGTSGRGKDIGK